MRLYLEKFKLHDFKKKIRNSSTKQRIISGTFWSFVATLFLRGSNLVAYILIARIIGKESFGEFGILQNTINMLSIFAGFGLGLTNIKFIAQYKKINKDKVAKIIAISNIFALAFGLLATAALYFSSDWLSNSILNSKSLSYYLKILAPSIIFIGMQGVQNGVFSGFERFKYLALTSLINSILSFPVLYLSTYFFHLDGLVWGMLINSIVQWGIGKIFVIKVMHSEKVKTIYNDLISELRIIWIFSLPAVINSLLVTPVSWISNSLLVNQPNGYSEMGIYNAANQWFNLLLILPSIIGNISVILLSEKSNENDNGKMYVKKMIFITSIIGGSLIGFTILFSNYIMSFYGTDFSNNGLVLTLLLITAFFYINQIPIGNFIAAQNKMWIGVTINLLWAVIFLVSTYFLIYQGALGLAMAKLISYSILFLIGVIYLINFKQK
jgi:O-antigen/teichoic acid export membrane protein